VIGSLHYYVDGILCELDRPVLYSAQPDLPGVQDQTGDGIYLVYMDVWERHISYVEDEQEDAPGIREVALGGPDTATRAKAVWQVKTLKLSGRQTRALGIRRGRAGSLDLVVDLDGFHAAWEEFAQSLWQPANRGRLKAWAGVPKDAGAAEYSEARYSGAENHLYRVEIHTGGRASEATFKWSRENGSVVFPILSVAGNDVILEHLGHGDRLGLKAGDWVELTDDDLVLHGAAEPLRQVVGRDPEEGRVTLDAPPSQLSGDQAKHPLLRRWDHRAALADSGGLHLDEGSGAARVCIDNGSVEGTSAWHLENGVQIEFCRPGASVFCTGDYWLIPARTATASRPSWPCRPGQIRATLTRY
jgi:hypothetical protein